MFSDWFAAYPWTIRRGSDLPDEFTRLLSDPELSGNALGGQVHWSIVLKPLLIMWGVIIGALAMVAVQAGADPIINGVAGALVLGAIFYFAWHLLLWRLDLIFITGKRVITLTGIFTRQVSMLPLSKLTDMSYTVTLAGRILGYGEFRMETAGQVQAVEKLKRIPDHLVSYQYVQNLLFGRGTTDVILIDVKTDKPVPVKFRSRTWRDRLDPTTRHAKTVEGETDWYDE